MNIIKALLDGNVKFEVGSLAQNLVTLFMFSPAIVPMICLMVWGKCFKTAAVTFSYGVIWGVILVNFGHAMSAWAGQ